MCGITGCWQPQGAVESELHETIQAMTAALHHRGPDSRGNWVWPNVGLALGHTRLAIVDLSPAGHQPMHSRCGRFSIVFNGEIYNHSSLREKLEIAGKTFRSTTDTEVLLEGFSAWGIVPTIEQSIGMFAIAVWDNHEQSLTLIRDRLGIKPLYYGTALHPGSHQQQFIFGSELKALTANRKFERRIDRDILPIFLRHNYIPAPFSIYKNIAKLPPGSMVTLKATNTIWPPVSRYWDHRDVAVKRLINPFRGSYEEACEELERLLISSVKLRMLADVPVGAFLSGGIDSSLVVALMQAQSTRPARTFSIGFTEAEYNEAPFARAVANHLKTDHTEFIVTPAEAMQVIPDLPKIYDEPFADSSQIPTSLVCRLARQHVTVALSGDGGDELFCGYRRYFDALRLGRLTAVTPAKARRLASLTLTGIAQQIGRWPQAQKLLRRGANLLSESSPSGVYKRNMQHWRDHESVLLDAHPPSTQFDYLIRNPIARDLQHSWMFTDAITYLPDDILTKVDRASMAVALEARVPLIDHRVAEFAWSIPIDFKRKDRTGKLPLRTLLAKHVPVSLFDRPKTGFGVPIDHWLRGPLREWAEDLLSEDRLRDDGYFNPAEIRKKWQEHQTRKADWHYHLWDVLMFQAWRAEHR